MTFKRATISVSSFVTALAAMVPAAQQGTAQVVSEDLLTAFEYRSIGPTRQSGRFIDFAVPSQEPFTFYAATASGHLWKTTNAGITFEPLFENEGVYSIGDITVAPSDPDILYLGSGEGNNSRSSYWGDGVYKSTDAGETWTNVGLPESHHIGRIVVHPTNPNVLYVAALGHLYSENPERGLYKSTNGGQSWDQVLAPVVEGKTIGVVDVAMSPDDPNTLIATTYDKVRVPYSFDLGGPGSRVYRSTNGGDDWEMLTNGLPQGMLGRIGVDIFDLDGDIMYVTIENANKEGMSDEDRYAELMGHQASGGMIGGEIYRSNDGGDSWAKANPDDQSIGGGPAYYYGQVIIDPNDPDVAFVLSVGVQGTRDGGETWNTRALSFGGDNHALWINPNDSNHMLLGYDHGLGITYDGGENWYHPDNLSLAQFYAIGYDMSYPYRVAGGLQDNGSHMAYSTRAGGGTMGLESWSSVGGGDGMYNVFDLCTNQTLYNESQFGPISRRDLITGESQGIRYSGEGLRWNWNAPIVVSTHDCDVVYHAANRLMRSPNRGESWEEISPDLTKADPATLTTGNGGDGNIQYATITSVSESVLRAGVLWVGTDDGNVQVTQDRGETWTLVNANIPNNPEYWVSMVEASHHLPGTAYVSYTGFRNDDFQPFVYKTTDYGATWTSIAGNLPPGPINVIREHQQNPNALFVGTDFGVFVSLNGGGAWTAMKNDMPTNPAYDIQIHPRENDLIVATHGRGVYIADISALSQITEEVLESDAYFFEPESKVRWVGGLNSASSSSNFNGESEPNAIQFYYYLDSSAGEPVTFTVYQGNTPIAIQQGSSDAGLHKVEWNMSRSENPTAAPAGGGGRGGRGGGRGGRGGGGGNSAAPVGRYRVEMSAGGVSMTRSVSILQDHWYLDRR